jgi:hypothetical protein
MAQMTISELRALLAAEKADALASVNASELSKQRADAMDYYNGDVSSDMPSLPGRSSAVSSDVADTIDGLMPGLMEIFCGGDEVVQFAAVGPEDVKQAEQETDYVNHVFMQQNAGFMTLYTFMKDALLSKVGIVKVWTEEEEETEEETYYGQSEDVLAFVVQNKDVQIVEHTPREDGTHDFKLRQTKKVKRHKVEPVPPEEFGIARNAKCIKDAGYTFHERKRTVGDLIAAGYDQDQIYALPSESEFSDNTEVQARDTVDETQSANNSDAMNKMMRQVTVTEAYYKMDYEGKGEVCLYKVVTGGSVGEVLTKNGKPDIEKVEYAPFAAMSPVPVPHRFFGKSVADLVMDIMRIKTALVRGMLDNLYKHNNPRPVVAEADANANTVDDLLNHAHGAMIRVKTNAPTAVAWQAVPDITGSIYPALQYLDATREWRTGVTRQGQGIDAEALQNQSATAVNQMMSAAQARQKMIARIFAETGIRDLFLLLHAEIRRHGQKADTVRLRNQWVPVDPRSWKTRKDLIVNVGIGSGNRTERVQQIMMLIGLQREALAAGKTHMVGDDNLFNSTKELTKLLDYKDPQVFFKDPSEMDEQGQPKNPPPPPQPSPEEMKIQADMQMKQADMQMRGQELQVKAGMDEQSDMRKAEIERMQAEADIATNDRKIQADMMLAQQKFELERELKMLDHQLKRELASAELEMKREAHEQAMSAGAFKMVAGAEQHGQKMEQQKAKASEASD